MKPLAPAPEKPFAWEGVSFTIPHNWELAIYKFPKGGTTRLEFEDEYAVRLEMEWIRPRRPVEESAVHERYKSTAEKLTAQADVSAPILGLPPDWHATLYTFKEVIPTKRKKGLTVVRHSLITAFHLPPGGRFFAFLQIHWLPTDTDDPVAILRQLTRDFRLHDAEPMRLWQLYDIAFTLPAEFKLEQAHVAVGSKLMRFSWRRRRLLLWHLSCADQFITPTTDGSRWVTAFLNSNTGFKGIHFFPGPEGTVIWKRRRRYPFGHREEWGRRCMHYAIHYFIDTSRNQLIVWVFQYRSESDLDQIPDTLKRHA